MGYIAFRDLWVLGLLLVHSVCSAMERIGASSVPMSSTSLVGLLLGIAGVAKFVLGIVDIVPIE